MSHDAKLGQLVVGIKWASFPYRSLRWVYIGRDSENKWFGGADDKRALLRIQLKFFFDFNHI